ncbi:four helix bundle protein [Arcicella lustrica]|uniref:Four helix bundle protein n=1 Tax=Arcicella lustrica TaxID=2984196 RepID=A0ABU5SKA9_9BACT|nr:four helix bundle protein [Arcicella sp. DC25W]MEA5427449.1 four helix bundle protein [Arcicella sp. DC25W]
MRDFRKLRVWEQSHHLTLLLYSQTKTFPNEEKYGITSQIRRAVASIPTNIAEGCGKIGDKDFARYLNISFGSASELEYLMILSKDLDYLSSDMFLTISTEIIAIKKQLYHLIIKLNAGS